MNYYQFYARDGLCDNGFWMVIIQAPGKRAAIAALKRHLKNKGREDYLAEADWECTKFIPADGILYTDVENKG
jgi:hypothetical protein